MKTDDVVAAVVPPTKALAGIWGYFCYEDSASMDGSSPKGHYSSECWRKQSRGPRNPAERGTLMMVKWRHVETADGVFDWKQFDANLTKASKLGLQLMVFVEICKADPGGPAAPDWLYDEIGGVNFTHVPKGTVPAANTTNPHRCPNYLDVRFQDNFSRLIKAMAAHIQQLPARTRVKVVAVQAAFGITGDDRPWNGVPILLKDWIADEKWKVYTRKMALVYCNAFKAIGLPVLFNLNNPGVNHSDDQWIVKQCPGSFVKLGQVSHGYQLNGERDLYNTWRAQGLGNVFSRGELALQPNPRNGTYGNWAVLPFWSLQANAEWALTFGLATWNLYDGFLGNDADARVL